MKRVHVLGLILFVSGVAYSQTVNQGAPGNQGPWPVKIQGVVPPVFPTDGGVPTGFVTAATYPYPCRVTTLDGGSPQFTLFMDGGVQNMPGSATSTAARNRLYTVICNSRDNSSGNARCTMNGTNPTTTVGSVGDVLAVGDCIPYTNPQSAPIKCIGVSIYLTGFECVSQ